MKTQTEDQGHLTQAFIYLICALFMFIVAISVPVLIFCACVKILFF